MASDHNQEQSNLLEAEISLTMGSLTSQTSSFAEQAEVLIASFDDMAEGTGAIDIVGRKLQAIVQKIRSISNNINDIESTTDFSEAVLLAQKMESLQQKLTNKVRSLLEQQFTELVKALNELQAVPVSIGNNDAAIQSGGYSQHVINTADQQKKPKYQNAEMSTAIKLLTVQSQKQMSIVLNAMKNVLGDSFDSGASLLLSMGYEVNKEFEYTMARAALNFRNKDAGTHNSPDSPVQNIALAYGLPLEDAATAYQHAATASTDPLEAQRIATSAAKQKNVGDMDIRQSASSLAALAVNWGLNAAGVEDAANMITTSSILTDSKISDIMDFLKQSSSFSPVSSNDEDKHKAMAYSIAMSSMYTSALARTGDHGEMFFKNMAIPLDEPSAKNFEVISQRTGLKTLNPWNEEKDENGRTIKQQKSGIDMLFAITDVIDRLTPEDHGFVRGTYTSKLGNDSGITAALFEDMDRIHRIPSIMAQGGAVRFVEKLQDKDWTANQSNQLLAENMLTPEFQEQKLKTMWEVSTKGIFDRLKKEFQTVSLRIITFLNVIRANAGLFTSGIESMGKVGQGYTAQKVPKEDLHNQIMAVQKRLDLVNSKCGVLRVGNLNDTLGKQHEEYEQLKQRRAEIERSGEYGSEVHMNINRQMNKKQWDINQTRRSLVWAQSVDPRLDLEAQHLERKLTFLIRQMKELGRQTESANNRMELLDLAIRDNRLDGDMLVETIAKISGGFLSGTISAQKFEEELRRIGSSTGYSDLRIKQFINDMVNLNKEFQDTSDIQKYIDALVQLENAAQLNNLEIANEKSAETKSKQTSEDKDKDKGKEGDKEEDKDDDEDENSAYETAKEIQEFFTDDWYEDEDDDKDDDDGGRRRGSGGSDEGDDGGRRRGSGGSDEDDDGGRRRGSGGSDEDDDGGRRGSGGSDEGDDGGRRRGSGGSDEGDDGGRRRGSGGSDRSSRRSRRRRAGGGRRGITSKLAGLTKGAGKLFSKAGKLGKLASATGKGLKIGLKKIPLISTVETAMDFYSDVVAPLSMSPEERKELDASGRVDLQKKAQAIGDGNFLQKAFGIGEMVLDGGIRGGINQIFGGAGVKWTEYADALKIAFSGKKGGDLAKALEQKLKGNADSKKESDKLEEKPKDSGKAIDSNEDSEQNSLGNLNQNQLIEYKDAQTIMSRNLNLQQNEATKIQAAHDENYAKLVMSGVREDSAEMRALFETYFKKNIEMLDGILNGTKNANGKIIDEGLIAKRDRLTVGSDSYNEIDAQIAKIKGQISSLNLQSYQMDTDGEFNDIMEQLNHDLKISNADWSMKRSDAILSGAKEDSNSVKQIQSAMASNVNSRIGITLSNLQALLVQNKDNETQRNKILEQIKELEVQQKNNLVDIKNSLLQGKSTFNLPEGVQAMSYYETKVSEGTAKQISFGSGDVNITIQANVKGQQDWAAVGNQVAGIVKNANVNVSRELSQQVKTGMQYNHR